VPQNKNDLIITYQSMTEITINMGEYSKAFECMKKLNEVLQNTFEPIHPSFVMFHKNMGVLYYDMRQYSKAREHFEKFLDLGQKLFPSNYADLLLCNSRICEIYVKMGDMFKAQTTFQQCMRIKQLAPAINMQMDAVFWLGKLYCAMKDYRKALAYFTRAIEITDTRRPDVHMALGVAYSNFGNVQQLLGNYKNALPALQQAIEIFEKNFTPRIELALAYSYMGETHRKMGNYRAALDFFEKAKTIRKALTPAQHPDLAASYYDFAQVYKNTKQNKLAYEQSQKALEIARHTLPEIHPDCVKYKQALTKMQVAK